MGEFEGKVAAITAATPGMSLVAAKQFLAEGAFITGHPQDKLDDAVKAIGHNVTRLRQNRRSCK